jgi:DnaK suppressor protein
MEANRAMNDRTLAKLRRALEDRKSQIEGEMSYMADEIRAIGIDQDDENGSLGNHIAEDGANVSEAERLVILSEDLQNILNQVNSALERMDEGTYGICQRCRKPIAMARLEAFPYVAYCIECQEVLERQQALRASA